MRILRLINSLHHLEVLRLEEMRDVEFLAVLSDILKAGGCPNLQRLIIGSLRGKCGNSAAMVLASTIQGRGLMKLRQLEFKHKSMGSLGLQQIAEALQQGGCPELVSLVSARALELCGA